MSARGLGRAQVEGGVDLDLDTNLRLSVGGVDGQVPSLSLASNVQLRLEVLLEGPGEPVTDRTFGLGGRGEVSKFVGIP